MRVNKAPGGCYFGAFRLQVIGVGVVIVVAYLAIVEDDVVSGVLFRVPRGPLCIVDGGIY